MPTDFAAQLDDPQDPLCMDLEARRGGGVLIGFAGLTGDLGIPTEELFDLVGDLDVGRICVRDLRQCWHQEGLPELSRDVDGTAAILKRSVTGAGFRRVVLVGHGMGGFAALLFGMLMNADVVHAFSPQTFIDAVNRRQHNDARWEAQLQRIRHLANSRYLDLSRRVASYHGAATLHVHYATSDPLDTIHAQRIADASAVTTHAYDHGGHELMAALRDEGVLQTLLRDALMG